MRAKEVAKEKKGKSKGKSKGTKGAKVSHKRETSKAGLSGLENSKSEISSETQESAPTCPTDTSWNNGWSFDEWNDDWSSVGWHEGLEKRMTLLQAHFHLEVWISVPRVVRRGLNG